MAKKMITVIVDDVDGIELSEYETVRWSVDGKHFEFDTSPENAGAFRKQFEEYRKISRKAPKGAAAPVAQGPNTADVRAWAVEQGIEISDRGRIPHDVMAAYLAGHAA